MNTLVYGHRGASGTAPENTMSAFIRAVEEGCHGIECDVQLSKDGKLVICHDERLERTTDGKGFIKDYSYDELKLLDAGSWFSHEFAGERIPLLDELLELIKKAGIIINIELKNGIILYPGMEKMVIDSLKNHGLLEKAIISSFNHYSIYEIKKLYKNVKAGALYMEGLYEPWEYMSKLGCECAHPFYLAVKPEIAAGYKKAGYEINTFTVDDPNYAKQLAMMGVDGIITNYPEKILAVLAPPA
ncbi:MAG: glycerophosphodiester phosphodiesterase [Bacillota bacterium]